MSFGLSYSEILAVLQEIAAAFGFAAEDLQSATEVGQQAMGALVTAQGHGDNVIILNFRALQAQRVKEMQAKLLDLSVKKIRQREGEDQEELEGLNNEVDVWLDRYGLSTSFLFQVHGRANICPSK
jgi:hypothetical protein